MQYFDHSTDAATDPKIMQLRLECSGAAVDAYWYLVEQMHRDEHPLCVSNANVMRVHCHTLCTDIQTLEKWVEAMVSIGLFHNVGNDGEIFSQRIEGNVSKYQAKQEKARSAAESRWNNADAMQTHKRTQSKRNANAMPTKQNKTNSSNAIKSITTTKEAPVVAAAAEAAPPVAKEEKPHCPLCNIKVYKNTQTGKWRCGNCFNEFPDESVVWR